jgi:hypothetical protein
MKAALSGVGSCPRRLSGGLEDWAKKHVSILAFAAIGALLRNSAMGDTLISSSTYSYTGSSVNYTVPSGTNYLIVKAWGAGGGDWVGYLYGGAGGFAEGTVTASPGSVYVVEVGGGGLRNTYGGTAGWPNGTAGTSDGGGGGGASIFYGGSTYIEAGGGGGASNAPGGVGGGGYYGTPGGLSQGSATGGGGGSNSAGGTGGENYFANVTSTTSEGQTGFAATAVNTSDPDYPGNYDGSGGGVSIHDGSPGYIVVKAYTTTTAPTFSGSLTTQNCDQNQSVSFTIPASGSPAPSFSATGLPPGLTCNSTTGVISGNAGIGTPGSNTYTYNSTVTATNSVGSVSGTLTYVVTAAQIVDAASITAPSPLYTNETISLVQGGTTNFPLAWTWGTMYNPDGTYTSLPSCTSEQTQSYTLTHGAGEYQWQFALDDIYGNYVDQWLSVTASLPPATPPTSVTATTVGSTLISLSWSGATTQTTIASYSIYRNGTFLASVATSATSGTYTDSTVSPLQNYTYTIVTVNTNGSTSLVSSGLFETTLADFEVFTPIP